MAVKSLVVLLEHVGWEEAIAISSAGCCLFWVYITSVKMKYIELQAPFLLTNDTKRLSPDTISMQG
jgi:hypothetical protein